MNERWRNLSANLASFLAPGLVLLLLGIQVAFGLRGFDRPDDSVLYVLQVPGVLLGWGGVALLLPLLAWMILDWWGYDLNGFALKGLGSAVLGIAVGSMFGLSGGVATGGVVGGGLAAVLGETVGSIVAWILLLLMAAPACVLALSLQRGAARPQRQPEEQPQDQPAQVRKRTAPTPSDTRAPSTGSGPAPSTGSGPSAATGGGGGLLAGIVTFLKRGSGRPEDKAWYPQKRFDVLGNEIPMAFDRSQDVSGVRFVDEAGVDTAAVTAAVKRKAVDPDAGPAEPVASEAADSSSVVSSSVVSEDVDTHADAPSASDLLGGSVGAAGTGASAEERLPTIPELLAGNFSGALAARESLADPSGGPREVAGAMPDEGPIHVDGKGRPVPAPGTTAPGPTLPGHPKSAAPARAGATSPAPRPAAPAPQPPLPFAAPEPVRTRSASAPEPTLPRGIRYADESEPLDSVAPASREATGDGQGKDATDNPTPEDQLSQAVRDAVRGPTLPAGDAKGQASARRIRKTLRQSVAALQVDGKPNRHLAKLEAMGLFDTFEPPPADSNPSTDSTSPTGGASPQNASSQDASAQRSASALGSPPSRGTGAPEASGGSGGGTATRATKATKASGTKKARARTQPAGKTAPAKAKAKPKRPRAAGPKKPAAPAKKAPARKKSTRRRSAGTSVRRARTQPPEPDAGTPSPAPESRGPQAARRRGDPATAVERTLLLEGLRIERLDPLFRRSVEVALQQGAASPVLLTRRLGLPFARAEALIDRLVATGVLRTHTHRGSHPLSISRREWESV